MKKNNLGLMLISLLASLLLLFTLSAHADFLKALEALQNRNGAMLLTEVKYAVEKKNNDGLMLFLNALDIDKSTSAKSNLYEFVKDKRSSTIQNILTESQQQQMFDLLIVAANNSTADAQFRLASIRPNKISWQKIYDKYAKIGSLVAMQYSSSSDLSKAEAGNPYVQLRLGLKYLNFFDYGGYGCNEPPPDAICHEKNETQGHFWLKQALKNYETKGHDDIGVYAGAMCDLLQQSPKENIAELKQAYLWCVMGINSGGQSSWRLLGKMEESGKLKIVAPEVAAIWRASTQQDKSRLFNMLILTEYPELPVWVVETRKELAKEDLPVFSYYSDDYMEYELDVYADGRINIGFGTVNNGYPGHESGSISFVDTEKDLLMQVSPQTINAFIADLKEIGFNDWPLNNYIFSFCDMPDATRCLPKRYQVTLRNGAKSRRVYLSGFAWDSNVREETPVTKRIAKIAALVEKYFPTRTLRCELGTSEEYKQACLQRDNRWATLAKEGI